MQTDLLPVIVGSGITATMTFFAGGLAGAWYTNRQISSRARQTRATVIVALRVDVKRVRSILEHNQRLLGNPNNDVPRPFVRYPTNTYEALVFAGQITSPADDQILEALMEYLQHANHINAMITTFERIETEPGAASDGSLMRKRRDTLLALQHSLQTL
jgi:hypothetical protein